MNEEEFSEKSSGFLLGREFIIVLVIVFSGLSFTLGFFVGKNSVPIPAPSLQPVETQNLQQNQDQMHAPRAAAQPVEQPQTVQPIQQTAPIPVKEIVPAAVSVPQKQEGREPESAKTPGKTEPSQTAEVKSTTYTVQIGAFKNMAEAKQLKAKLEKKGYKSVISSAKNSKGQKIFKVKTGEFSDKKEASVHALKLKKSEGLQTYVTTRAE